MFPEVVLESILKRLRLKTKTEFRGFLEELKASYESFDSKVKEKAGTSRTQIPYLIKFWKNWLDKFHQVYLQFLNLLKHLLWDENIFLYIYALYL